MCDFPWSNLDMFASYTDCHIYFPLLTFLFTLNIIGSFIALGYALREALKRTRKNIPLVCLVNEFLFGLSYIWCLGMNETFISGNYALNLVFGICQGGFYLTLNLFTLRNAEVLLTIDKIKPEHDIQLVISQFIMTRVILFISLPGTCLSFILPIILPNQLPMSYFVLYMQIILTTISSSLSWFYLYKLRKKIYP